MVRRRYGYTIAPQALSDLDKVWLFIAKDNVDAADRVADNLYRTFLMLARNPRIGLERDDLLARMRMHPHETYNIFYYPTEQGVEIYRVLHSARDITQIFDQAIDMLEGDE